MKSSATSPSKMGTVFDARDVTADRSRRWILLTFMFKKEITETFTPNSGVPEEKEVVNSSVIRSQPQPGNFFATRIETFFELKLFNCSFIGKLAFHMGKMAVSPPNRS